MKRTIISLILLSLFAAKVASAAVALQIGPGEGAAFSPFVLEAVLEEGSTAWFDAEKWLGYFPGVLTWDADDKRLTLDSGESWAALKAQPPYAMRDGRGLEIAENDAPRMEAGRLVVSEGFLVRHGSALVGVNVQTKRKEDGPGRMVVIDPAFGGSDVGGVGVDKLLAKDVLLSFARTLAEDLERVGYRVHLTRRTDEAVDSDRRASIANYWGGELFISLQATGRARPQARGYQVFFPKVPGRCDDPLRWECAQLDFAGQSRRLAGVINAELGRSLATFDLGVTELANPLMAAVHSPAALVVVGNLAWPQEAEIFMDETQRQGLSEALVDAVDRFFREGR
jgi:N-acetylmuramoyl-L-alanine amidase